MEKPAVMELPEIRVHWKLILRLSYSLDIQKNEYMMWETDFNLYFISVTDEWMRAPVGLCLYVEVLGCSCLWRWCWWQSFWWSPFSPLHLHFERSFLDAAPQRGSGHAEDKKRQESRTWGGCGLMTLYAEGMVLIYYSYHFSLQYFMTTKMAKLVEFQVYFQDVRTQGFKLWPVFLWLHFIIPNVPESASEWHMNQHKLVLLAAPCLVNLELNSSATLLALCSALS